MNEFKEPLIYLAIFIGIFVLVWKYTSKKTLAWAITAACLVGLGRTIGTGAGCCGGSDQAWLIPLSILLVVIIVTIWVVYFRVKHR